MKKFSIVFLCLIIILSCIPFSGICTLAKEYTNEDFKYEILKDGNIMITEYIGTDKEIVSIPSRIDGKRVTILSNGIFGLVSNYNINIINVPATVNTIEDLVFYRTHHLKEINVDSKNLTYYSDNGVLINKKKQAVICYPREKEEGKYYVPNGVKTIGRYSFSYTLVENVYLPDSVTNIRYGAFYCSHIMNLRISRNLKKIDNIAFAQLNTTKLFIPKSVSTIERLAFGYGASSNYTIYGYNNSYVQKYCKMKSINFVAVDPAAPKKTTVRGAKGKIKVNYKKVKRAKGFQVKAVSGKKKTVKIFKTEKSAKKSLKGMKKGTYKVKVRAFNTYNGEKIYGPWAKAKTVTVK